MHNSGSDSTGYLGHDLGASWSAWGMGWHVYQLQHGGQSQINREGSAAVAGALRGACGGAA